MILQNEVTIEDFDNQGSLYNRCMFKAIESFNEVLLAVINRLNGKEQIGLDPIIGVNVRTMEK
jgi:hypothetical protein